MLTKLGVMYVLLTHPFRSLLTPCQPPGSNGPVQKDCRLGVWPALSLQLKLR